MSITGILFNPEGRIGPRSFWKGIIVLIGFQIVAGIASEFAPFIVAAIFGLLSFAIIYPYVCVFGKRMHDAGHTAWLYLAFLFGYFVLYVLTLIVLLPFFVGDLMTFMEDVMVATQEGQTEAVEELEAKVLMPSILAMIIGNVLVGAIAAILKSDPEVNEHGPPEGISAAAFD